MLTLGRLTVHADRTLPAGFWESVSPHLSKWHKVVPCWCLELIIAYDGTDTECAAKIAAEPEYRRARIELCAGWMEEPEDHEKNLLHELMHLPLKPMTNMVNALIAQLQLENRPLAAFLDTEWGLAYEGAVEDLRLAFLA